MFRNDDGNPMTIQQVCGIAWEQFGLPELLAEYAGILAWNARHLGAKNAEAVAKDAETLAMIAERLGRIDEEERSGVY